VVDEPAVAPIPLAEVPFCVVDLETTGGSAALDTITEVGAVVVRGGEVLRVLHTLVDPCVEVPERITALTGISSGILAGRPRIAAVLPSLLEFARGTVVVGHNVRFDLSFLNASLDRLDYPLLLDHAIDTVALARRLLRDESPTCRLGDLARHLRLEHVPTHRALDDAWATVDLLHLLLERAAGYGVDALDDLVALPSLLAHPQARKLRLTARLPRAPGVYTFHGARDEVLRVGAADDVRRAVRQHFASRDGRVVGPMLRELQRVGHTAPADGAGFASAVDELVRTHRPRYQGTARRPARQHR